MRLSITHFLFLASLPVLAAGPARFIACNIGVRLVSPASAAFSSEPSTMMILSLKQVSGLAPKASANSALVLTRGPLPSHLGCETPVLGAFNAPTTAVPAMPTKTSSTKLSHNAATLLLAYN